jgi:hypothetical protein
MVELAFVDVLQPWNPVVVECLENELPGVSLIVFVWSFVITVVGDLFS